MSRSRINLVIWLFAVSLLLFLPVAIVSASPPGQAGDTDTPTPVSQATATATETPAETATATQIPTPPPTESATPTPTAVPTATATDTPVPTDTAVSEATATGTLIPTSTLTPTATATFTPTATPSNISSLPFSDDFENGLANWQAEGDWGLITNTVRSGSFAVTDSPHGNYQHGFETGLRLDKTIELSGTIAPRLTFWNMYGRL